MIHRNQYTLYSREKLTLLEWLSLSVDEINTLRVIDIARAVCFSSLAKTVVFVPTWTKWQPIILNSRQLTAAVSGVKMHSRHTWQLNRATISERTREISELSQLGIAEFRGAVRRNAGQFIFTINRYCYYRLRDARYALRRQWEESSVGLSTITERSEETWRERETRGSGARNITRESQPRTMTEMRGECRVKRGKNPLYYGRIMRV